MAVYVEMTVKVSDRDKFLSAMKAGQAAMAEAGATMQWVGSLQSDPNMMAVGAVWPSHDAMHAATEKSGEELNKMAGTEGLEWETKVWDIVE